MCDERTAEDKMCDERTAEDNWGTRTSLSSSRPLQWVTHTLSFNQPNSGLWKHIFHSSGHFIIHSHTLTQFHSFIHLVILSFIHPLHTLSFNHSFIYSYTHLSFHSLGHFIIQRPGMFNSSLNILYPFYADSTLPYPDQNFPIYHYWSILFLYLILTYSLPLILNIHGIYNYTIYISTLNYKLT